ncbi:hypothetical protein ACIRVF_24825 [Kitasatospora sp. NPDC101157]
MPRHVVTTVPDDRWTPERARSYDDRLPPRAQQISSRSSRAEASAPQWR